MFGSLPVNVAVSLFWLSVLACLRQPGRVLVVFGFGSGFRSSFAVWLLPLSCLFAFGLGCWHCFFISLTGVKRLVSVALQNSVLGLALQVSVFISAGGGNAWLLLGGVFLHPLTAVSSFVWSVAVQFSLHLLWFLRFLVGLF